MFNRSQSTVELVEPELFSAICAEIAACNKNGIPNDESNLSRVRTEVAALVRRFPVYGA
jgi:hypothetical protein